MRGVSSAIAALSLSALLFAPHGGAVAQSYDESGGLGYRSLTPISRPVSRNDDQGIRLGQFVVHLGGGLATGFDSNVFFASQKSDLDSSFLFQLMPTLRIEPRNPRLLRIRSNAQLMWGLYTAENQQIQSQGGIELLADNSLQMGATGMVSFSLYDVVRRRITSPGYPGEETQDHLYHEVGAALALHPGGADRTSRLGFTAGLTGGYGNDRWNKELDLDAQLFLLGWTVKYHFFPLTAVYIRGGYQMVWYETRERTTFWDAEEVLPPLYQAFAGSPLINVNSSPLRLYGGLAGLLTHRVNVRLEGGYGFGFYEEEPSFEGWLGRAEVGLSISRRTHVLVGWERGFADSTFTNYYAFHRFFSQVKVDAAEWYFGGQASVELQQFAAVDPPVMETASGEIPLFNQSEREDPLLSATAFVAYNLTDWLRLSGYYTLRANLTRFVVTTFSGDGLEQYRSQGDYLKHQFFLATEFEY
ncbi:MAG: hypothetical protein JW797_11530 [Bradymonadales bacterium]|nr:hypothetical protein [Bradymonadales bacterium]